MCKVIQEDLSISKGKALECLQELEDIGLICARVRCDMYGKEFYFLILLREGSVVSD